MPIGIKAPEVITEASAIAINTKAVSYEDTKSRRILVQGIVQAVVQSPIVAGLGYTNDETAVAKVKSVSLELIKFVDEQTR